MFPLWHLKDISKSTGQNRTEPLIDLQNLFYLSLLCYSSWQFHPYITDTLDPSFHTPHPIFPEILLALRPESNHVSQLPLLQPVLATNTASLITALASE